MLTREIKDNKTLTIKSSYHTEYQQSRKEQILSIIYFIIIFIVALDFFNKHFI